MKTDLSTLLLAVVIMFVLYLSSGLFIAPTYQLRHIPTVGSSGFLSSYWGAFRFFLHGHDIIQDGYNKHYGSAFKVANLSRWLVVVSGPQMIEDIRQASDDQLSFNEAIAEIIQTDYTLGSQIRTDPYHIPVIRTSLTRNIAVRFPEIKDEIEVSVSELIPLTDEWKAVSTLSTVMKVVSRTISRFYFDLPLCRDPQYLELQGQFAIDLFMTAQIVNLFPKILRPLVGLITSKLSTTIKRATFHLGPMIEAQLEGEQEFGKYWAERPNNLIAWLLEETRGSDKTIYEIVVRILAGNAAGIIPISGAFAEILYDLATHPEYVEMMREEVELVTKADGWTKASIGKMHRLDSFVKESQRLGIGSISMVRRVMKDFTFTNGVTVPAGTDIAVATHATHTDAKRYDNPRTFQALRFVGTPDAQDTSHQLVSLDPHLDYLGFGVGTHACAGRFLVATVLKATLAHILLNYDVKLCDGTARPSPTWFYGVPWPNKTADVMFRKRS